MNKFITKNYKIMCALPKYLYIPSYRVKVNKKTERNLQKKKIIIFVL